MLCINSCAAVLGGLTFLSAAAHAQVTYETQSSGPIFVTGLDLSDGDRPPEVDFSTFDSSLGTLLSVQVSISGYLSDTIFDPTGQIHAPMMVPAIFNISNIGPAAYQILYETIPTNSNGLTASPYDTFNSTYFAGNLAAFSQANYFQLLPSVFVQELSGPDTYDNATIDYQITETFTYDAIPEPATLAAFGVGLIVVGYVRRRRTTA